MPGSKQEKKEYILITSDNRSADSVSTTDFTLRLAVPIHDVVKTDLVQISMDYNVANIQAPNNTISLGQGLLNGHNNPVLNTYILEDGLYTLDVLASWIQQQLGPGYSVYYGVDSKLMIEYQLAAAAGPDDSVATRVLSVNVPLASHLGLNLNTVVEPKTLIPTFNEFDGLYGTYRWTFPNPVKLSGIYPYLFIQSRELGTAIKVANGAMGFWRMLLNDQVNYSLTTVNTRVDTYQDTPRILKDIDIKLVYPDGTDVNNNGGRFTLLLEIVRLV